MEFYCDKHLSKAEQVKEVLIFMFEISLNGWCHLIQKKKTVIKKNYTKLKYTKLIWIRYN